MTSFQDNPYQFLPQPPAYDPSEYEGNFLQALLGDPDPQVHTKAEISALLAANQSAVGLVTLYNGAACVVYDHLAVTRRVVVNGVRTTIADWNISLYLPAPENTIGAVTTYLSSLP